MFRISIIMALGLLLASNLAFAQSGAIVTGEEGCWFGKCGTDEIELRESQALGDKIVYVCYPTGEQPRIWINEEQIDPSSFPSMQLILDGMAGALGEIFITLDGIPLMRSANGKYFDASRKTSMQRIIDKTDFANSSFQQPYLMFLDYTHQRFSEVPVEWGGAALAQIDPNGEMTSIAVLSHSLIVEVYSWMHASDAQGNTVEMYVSNPAAKCQRA